MHVYCILMASATRQWIGMGLFCFRVFFLCAFLPLSLLYVYICLACMYHVYTCVSHVWQHPQKSEDPPYNWNYRLLLAPKDSTTYPSGLLSDSTFDELFIACISRLFFLPRPSSALYSCSYQDS